MRCFVAIELPAEIRGALAALTLRWASDARDVRFCRAEQFHVTLKFLGEIGPEAVGPISAVSAAAARSIDPFPLQFGGLGAFPAPRSPRVLWYGAADDAQGCARWLERAQPGLSELGIADEARRPHPHVTLARSRSPAGSRALRRILDDPPPVRSFSLLVRELTLFESRLGPGGSAYRVLERFPLGGGDLDAPTARD